MSRPFYALIVSFFLLAWSQSAFAVLKVLEGEHTVVYDIVNPRGVAFIPDYANESFVQKVENLDEFSKRVTVTSMMDNPAVIKGLRASGSSRTDIIVAQADAQMLRALGNKGDFLRNCRVIIVY